MLIRDRSSDSLFERLQSFTPYRGRYLGRRAKRRVLSRRTRLSVAVCAITLTVAALSCTESATVVIHPNQDTSIYSESDNSNAVGALYSGTTNRDAIRRALLRFDIAGSIPPGATIDSVSLTLTQTKISPGVTALFELRPLRADWGEGTSFGSGAGALPSPGDATWNFRRFNTNTWNSPGGDAGAPSGTATIGTGVGVTYTFGSQAGMVADVQSWLNTPGTNFGWLLRAANESPAITSAREFGSRESDLTQQPTLTINFTPVPEPGTAGLLGAAAMLSCVRRRRSRPFG